MPYIDIEGEIPTNLDSFTTYQAYNILDSAATAQLLPEILGKMNENHRLTYRREMRTLALCLELSTKGFPIDQMCLAELLYSLEKDERKALRILHQFCEAVDFRPIKPRSQKDIIDLFYHHLGLPEIHEYDRKTKQRRTTGDRSSPRLKTLPIFAASRYARIALTRGIAIG